MSNFTTTTVADRRQNLRPSIATAGDRNTVYIATKEYPNGITSSYNIVLYKKDPEDGSFTKTILSSVTPS